MAKPRKTVAERRWEAEAKAGMWLAKGNEYNERGQFKKADECYWKSQFWLDRANLLSNQGERPAPRA